MRAKILPITAQEMRDLAIEAGVNVPIEQTWVWAEFEETFPHRKLLGFAKAVVDDEPVAIFSLVKDKLRGFDFLWAKHGPVWLVEESRELEHATVDALVRWIRKRDPKIAFVRLHLRYPRKRDESPLGAPAFDEGLILDLRADEDAFRNSLLEKERQKLDLALDQKNLEIRNVTAESLEHFDEFREVVEQEEDYVPARDFPALSPEDQRNLLATLGMDHTQVYLAIRKDEDGEEQPVAWAVFTLGGTEAVYYLSAIADGSEQHAPLSQVLHRASHDLRKRGVKTIDMVGIGPDLLPKGTEADAEEQEELSVKFSQDTTHVRPAYDVPVNRVLFALAEQTELPHKAVGKIKRKLKRREKND